MTISFDDNQIASKDGVPMVTPRDANFDPYALLGGLDDTGTFRFAKFTSDGKLKIDAAIDIGNVYMLVKGITGAEIQVSGGTNPDDTTKFLYSQDQRMNFSNGQLETSDTINSSVVSDTLALTTVPVVARIGASNLVNRKALVLQAKSDNILFGFSNSSLPFSLSNNEKAAFDIGPNIDIWVKMATSTGSIVVAEFS
jgi:hypothetical protein